MKIIYILLLFFFGCPLPSFAQGELSGTWQSITIDGESTSADFLSLSLEENKEILTGRYCYTIDHGRRDDCSPSNNLRGKVNNNKAELVIYTDSGKISDNKVLLIINDGLLTWQRLGNTSGDIMIPELSTLERLTERTKGLHILKTRGFFIRIVNHCGDEHVVCNQVDYRGENRSNSNVISLTGKSYINDEGGLIYTFENGGYIYQLIKEQGVVIVRENGRVILKQQGEWLR